MIPNPSPKPENHARSLEWYVVAGHTLEATRIAARVPSRPTIVMLHEGLGSISQWRNFPELVAQATGCEVFAYSRYGYGQSDALEDARDASYMHHEAETALPSVLEQARIQRPILLGHSDGASISLLFAFRFPDRTAGIILEAPHVFLEDRTIEGLAQAAILYQTTDLPQKLARHHKDADRTFWSWNRVWLDPRFRAWNIESCLDDIRCPVLMIQGEDDEYGTVRQLEAIQSRIPAAQLVLLPNCGHTPHREHPEATLARIVAFVERCAKPEA